MGPKQRRYVPANAPRVTPKAAATAQPKPPPKAQHEARPRRARSPSRRSAGVLASTFAEFFRIASGPHTLRFEYDGAEVCVPAPMTYDDALALVQSKFPALAPVSRTRIALVFNHGTPHAVRVPPGPEWARVAPQLPRNKLATVLLLPGFAIRGPDGRPVRDLGPVPGALPMHEGEERERERVFREEEGEEAEWTSDCETLAEGEAGERPGKRNTLGLPGLPGKSVEGMPPMRA